MRQVGLGDPGTMVAHRHLGAGDLDLDLTVRGAPLDRVVDEVRDCPLEQLRISAHERRGEPRGEHERRRARACALDDRGRDLVEANLLDAQPPLLAASELDEVGDEPRQLLQLRPRLVERARRFRRWEAALLKQLEVRPQRRQRGAQLV